jgi:hypothetical protein
MIAVCRDALNPEFVPQIRFRWKAKNWNHLTGITSQRKRWLGKRILQSTRYCSVGTCASMQATHNAWQALNREQMNFHSFTCGESDRESKIEVITEQ